MTTTKALYYRIGTYKKCIAFTRRTDVWTGKQLAAEGEQLDADGQGLRKGGLGQREIGASAADTQKCTLEGVIQCAA